MWVNHQKKMLNKYKGKTIEEIKDEEEKRRIIALLEFGISYTDERTPEEIWDEQFALLKGLKEAKGSYYNLSEEQVRGEQEKLKKQGSISVRLKLQTKEDEKPLALGIWVNHQKQMLNRYRGEKIEEIKNNESIDKEEKRRIIALLEFGISYTDERTPKEIWNEQFELLKGLKEAEGSYYNLSEEQVRKEQEKIKKRIYF